MTDEQEYVPTFEDQLISRLANRVGVASAQVDALQLQLEIAHARIEQLEAQVQVQTAGVSDVPADD